MKTMTKDELMDVNGGWAVLTGLLVMLAVDALNNMDDIADGWEKGGEVAGSQEDGKDD